MTDTNTPDIICEFPWLVCCLKHQSGTGAGLLSRLCGDIAEITQAAVWPLPLETKSSNQPNKEATFRTL